MTPRRKVLFVEDEPDLRKAYRRFFAERYDVALAGTGAEALVEFDRFKPDVVVLDMRLPDTDGIDVLRHFRSARPDLPVVITTAYTSMQPLVEVLGMDYSGYLVKPYELSDLAERNDATG
jgi:DNA-binding response OmpR family regulator